MTREETVKVLSVIKTAYPNAFKSANDAKSIVALWAINFSKEPYELILEAVKQIITNNIFAPSISEVKEKLSGMCEEAQLLLDNHNHYNFYPERCKTCEINCDDNIEVLKKCGAILCPRQIKEETHKRYSLSESEKIKLENIVEALQPQKETKSSVRNIISNGLQKPMLGGAIK